jgi:hypothetical protein
MIPSWRTTAFLLTLIVFLNKWHLKKCTLLCGFVSSWCALLLMFFLVTNVREVYLVHIRHRTVSGGGTFVSSTHKVVATLILVVLCCVMLEVLFRSFLCNLIEKLHNCDQHVIVISVFC